MKVARLFEPRDLRIVEEAEPKLSDGNLLVKITSVGVCGSDVHWYQDGHIGPTYLKEPLVLGHEISGEVVSVGKGVTGYEPGMPVALEPGVPCGKCAFCRRGFYNVCPDMRFCGTPPTDGAYQEYMVHPPRWAYPLPANVSPDEGTLAETLAVAIHAVDLSHIKAGMTAAIFGVGPVGLCILQTVKLSGATDIIVVDPIEERLEKAKKLGAAAVINPKKTNPVEEIKRMTGGLGVHVSFEAAGVTETPEQCAQITRPAGRVVLIGIPAEDKITMEASNARRKGLSIMLVRRMMHTYDRSLDLVSRGMVDVKTLVSHKFGLDDVRKAFELVDRYDDGVIKAVVNI